MAKEKNKKPLLQENVFKRFAQLSGKESVIKPLMERFYAKEEQTNEAQEELEEIETKNQARVSGESDRLYENADEELPPPESGEGDLPPPPTDDIPPEGDVGGMEGEVEELVQVIAQALADKTGVEISVDGQPVGSAGMGGEMGGEMPPDMGGGEMPPPEAGSVGGELPPSDGEEDEMMETDRYMMEKGYVREGTGFKKLEGKQLAEAKKAFEDKLKESKKLQEGKEKLEEEEKLEEDSAQEKAQGKPKPGTHEKVKGADSPKEIPDGGDPATKPMKEAPKPKLPSEPVNESAIAKRVLQRLLSEIKARNAKLTPAEQKAAVAKALQDKKAALRNAGSKKK